MATIVIDGQEYELEALSAEARQQIVNLRMVDQEIARLQVQLAIAQTARGAYSNSLKSLLPKGEAKPQSPLERAMAAGEYLNLE